VPPPDPPDPPEPEPPALTSTAGVRGSSRATGYEQQGKAETRRSRAISREKARGMAHSFFPIGRATGKRTLVRLPRNRDRYRW